MTNQQQLVLLSWRTSKWTNIIAWVQQGSVLGSLLFLIYINDLPDGLKSICKIFADGRWYATIFEIKDVDTSNTDIGNDLVIISRWAYHRKMFFNPDINKQATSIFFSKAWNIFVSTNYFQQQQCTKFYLLKCLALVLGSKLCFNEQKGSCTFIFTNLILSW